MTSLSSLGVSQIVIQFDLNRNIDLASQDIQAAITAASKFLPQAMTQPPNYKKVNPADAPIIMLWAHSDTLPLTTVHDYLDNFFIQALSQLRGVAQASIIGDQKPSIRVQVDPGKLAAIGLTLEEVRTKIVNATSNAAKGTIYTPKVGYSIAANDQLAEATSPASPITNRASCSRCASCPAPMSSTPSSSSRRSCRSSPRTFRRR
jgi:multidrug efflux pump subunit AcrB